MTDLELIRTNLSRYTFDSKKIKSWVENNASGKVLNLFAGRNYLDLEEVRNDVDPEANADYNMDAVDFVRSWQGDFFDTVIVDPPYSYRKSMEMYNGNYSSRFKQLADELPRLLNPGAGVISFGYHSTFMGAVRDFDLETLCVFAHGGSQHCTIGIVERWRL